MIPYGHQDIDQSDIDAVADVLRSDFITQGPAIPRFEQSVSQRVGAKHGIAVNNATSGLHIACLALGLGPGDRLWTVPNTFVASANCGLYCGAEVDFVDIDIDTGNLSVEALRLKLIKARAQNRLPKIVVPVHFSGQPTDQAEIHALAREFGFKIIEDAAHSIGAARNGEPAGSCRWSDITVFSFHPVKIITTGEGGLALTNDDELAERMSLLRSHGITREPARLLQHKSAAVQISPPAWYYEQQLLGFNYRMTDIQAALGHSQLQRIDQFIARRRELAMRYDEMLSGLPLFKPHQRPGNASAWHLYVVRLDRALANKSRQTVFDELRARGIGVNVHYIPVHLQPYYRKLGFKPGDFPNAEQHYTEAISLPLFSALTDAEQDQVVEALRKTLQ
jgi:UDP-4-amino-4,6-dideoxy-N-acetyl-beta-L-altrosamine transaminase